MRVVHWSVAALCLFLASCKAQPPAAEPPGAAVSTTPAATSAAQPSAPAAAATPQPAAGGNSSVSHETNWPGVTAEVTEFVRKGNTLTAQVRFRNLGTKSQVALIGFDDVYVVDEGGAKKYLVLKDDKGIALASSATGGNTWAESIDPGQALTIWMKFPAPPHDVLTATLQIPKTRPFEDLHIEDR